MERKIDRFLQYLEYKGINDNKATVECGLSNGLINQAKRGKADLGNKSLDKILNKYQDLSRVWLLTGEGHMINDGNAATVGGNNSGINNSGTINMTHSSIDNRQYYSDSPDVLRAEIDKLDRIIAEKEERIKEKDSQIKEKDSQIKALLEILSNK